MAWAGSTCGARGVVKLRCYSLDIGGSSVKQALVDTDGRQARIIERLESVSLESRKFGDLRVQVLNAAAEALSGWPDVETVAISTTGVVGQSGLVQNAGHFIGYSHVWWRDIFTSEFRQVKHVTTTNDGKASTWAEYALQAGDPAVFVSFVVGTGVGGGIVCYDRLVFGDDDSAGGVGHQKVELSGMGVKCSCRRYGCVEPLSSGPAVVRAFIARGGSLRNDGGESELDEVAHAARRGDAAAVAAFEDAGGWLGVAISNIMNVLNPKVITVGGGVILASTAIDSEPGGPYLREATRRAGELALQGLDEVTSIMPAATQNDGGLLGAALLGYRERYAR